MRKKAKQPVKTVVAFILDKSGSMSGAQDAAISGFNEYLQTTKKTNEPGICSFNLTLFDTEIERVYQNIDAHEVKELNEKTYDPSGMTALYDAAVTTIEEVAAEVEKRRDKPAVLITIMTDGEENSSRKYDEGCLADLIKKLEKKGNYTFVFMGANQDSYSKAAKLGISQANTMNWNNDKEGTIAVFRSYAQGSVHYAAAMADNSAKGVALNSSGFFNT